MSLFIKDGKIKNAALLNAFMLSMAYCAVYVAAFAASSGILEKLIPETTANALLVWLPPALIRLFASVICALPLFFVSSAGSVKGAFVLVALYALFFAAVLFFKSEGDARKSVIQPLIFYFVFPAFFGNLVCRVVLFLKASPHCVGRHTEAGNGTEKRVREVSSEMVRGNDVHSTEPRSSEGSPLD
jgi:hypothetical protein